MSRATMAQRFWAKTAPGENGCIIWTASRFRKGYGSFRALGRNQHAHRFSYEMAKGPIPVGLFVMHTCDNPPCVNPDHLRVGTNQDNMDDMYAKGRGRKRGIKGPDRTDAKLTERAVIEILSSDDPHTVLGQKYGVDEAAIRLVRRRKNWAWVTHQRAEKGANQ